MVGEDGVAVSGNGTFTSPAILLCRFHLGSILRRPAAYKVPVVGRRSEPLPVGLRLSGNLRQHLLQESAELQGPLEFRPSSRHQESRITRAREEAVNERSGRIAGR
ncbi:hypothetical protein C2S52_022495 [Perilla frutescens var. hirtella]|nr:hypothetical protein C2S52_022495 [Perilla frutescens var. hirtella]